MGANSKREPSSDQRGVAIMWHEMYIALRDAGFTESQALTIIGQNIMASFIAGSLDNDDDDNSG